MKTVNVSKNLYGNYMRKAQECLDAENAVRDSERFYSWVKEKLAIQ